MPPATPSATVTPIPVPDIDSETPVVVVPVASVAPLDGPPDGERINIFALAPPQRPVGGGLDTLRSRVLQKPLTYMAGAFLLGVVFDRRLR